MRHHILLKKVPFPRRPLRNLKIGLRGALENGSDYLHVKARQIWLAHNREIRHHNLLKEVSFSRRPLQNLNIGDRGALENGSEYLHVKAR